MRTLTQLPWGELTDQPRTVMVQRLKKAFVSRVSVLEEGMRQLRRRIYDLTPPTIADLTDAERQTLVFLGSQWGDNIKEEALINWLLSGIRRPAKVGRKRIVRRLTSGRKPRCYYLPTHPRAS